MAEPSSQTGEDSPENSNASDVVADLYAHSPNDTVWQNGEAKDLPEVKKALETRAKTGIPMEGFNLARTNLAGIDLVDRKDHKGFQLKNSDFYRADLTKAHCYRLDFSGSSLMKANFTGANLHCANLSGCNLLGAVFAKAKIEHIDWGEKLFQESEAEKSTDLEEKHDFYQQAEEIYRHLRKVAEAQGLFDTAGIFFQKEMLVRRYQLPKYSMGRFVSKLVDLFCGYGEEPYRVILFSMIMILMFSFAYFGLGISGGDELLRIGGDTFEKDLQQFFSCLYFSVVTFTTLGYGDLTPVGFSRFFAAMEAFIGSFTLALFVVVFVKKMTR